MRSCASGAPHDAVDVDLHNTTGPLGRTVDESTILPGNTAVGHKDIQTTVELGDNVVDGLLNCLGRDDINLECSAWFCISCVLMIH